MPAFVRIEIRDDLRCNSGALVGVLRNEDLLSASDVQAIDDQESLTFAFSPVDASGAARGLVSAMQGRQIASVIWDDGSFDEWRIAIIDRSRGLAQPIQVTANPLSNDLTDGADSSTGKGFVSAVQNCLRVFDFAAGPITPSDFWDTYIIPACPSWVSRGTIDPTNSIASLSWDRLTPWALALQVRDTLRKMNVTCELRLRRNGTTDYKLDLVTQVGASATVPLLHPWTSLQAYRTRAETTEQTTRLFVIGESDPSGLPGIPGRARWIVTNIDAGNKRLTLADPNGGSGPIGFDDQWVGAYLLRVQTGRTFAIQASDADFQTLDLLDLSTFAVGEFVEFRLTEPGTNTRVRANPNSRFAISAVAAGQLTLSGNPVSVDDQFVDWYVRVWTASSGGSQVGTPQRVSDSTASTDVVLIASSTGFTTSHFVEFIQLDGAGEIPSYLEHPAALDEYGAKVGDLPVSSVLGVVQLQPNPWMRTWANGANPPDGYHLSSATGARNTTADFIRTGPYSYQITGFAPTTSFWGPVARSAWAPGNTRVSARIYVWVSSVIGTPSLTFSLYTADASGSFATQLGATTVAAPLATGDWIAIEVIGVDLAAYDPTYGIVARLAVGGTIGVDSLSCYVDSIELYPFVDTPDGAYEFGDATALVQVGNSRLGNYGPMPTSYELTVHDLERSDPTLFARNALTLGGSVRPVDRDGDLDATLRVMRWERNLKSPKSTQLTLQTIATQFTQIAVIQ